MLTEFDGIVQKIVENLLDFMRICIDHGFLWKKEKLDGNMLFGADPFEGICGLFDHFLNIKGFFVQKKLLGVKFVEGEQIPGEDPSDHRFLQK